MIVSCPACGARYRLADDAIPAEGRAMRCASCKHRWFELGAEDAPFVAPPIPPVLGPASDAPPVRARPAAMPKRLPRVDGGGEAADELATARLRAVPPDETDTNEDATRPARPVLKTIVALLLSAALFAGAAAMWIPDLPPLDLSRVPWLEALVHPPAPPRSSLTVQFTVDRQPLGDGRTVFALTGTLTNPTAQAQAIPTVEARLLDDSGRVTYRWPVAVPRVSLPAHRALPFEASAIGDTAGGARVVVALR